MLDEAANYKNKRTTVDGPQHAACHRLIHDTLQYTTAIQQVQATRPVYMDVFRASVFQQQRNAPILASHGYSSKPHLEVMIFQTINIYLGSQLC